MCLRLISSKAFSEEEGGLEGVGAAGLEVCVEPLASDAKLQSRLDMVQSRHVGRRSSHYRQV
jgi:hypothetical protein